MARQFTEAENDFDGVARVLSRLVPPKVTLEGILGRLREVMLERKGKGKGKGKGVTGRQMVKVLEKRGINVSERKLRTFLETGQLGPGRKPAVIAPPPAPAVEGGDEF